MNVGPWQLILIAVVLLLLFGRGRISEVMGDFGKGISSFKKGLNEAEKEAEAAKQLPQSPVTPTDSNTIKTDDKTGA